MLRFIPRRVAVWVAIVCLAMTLVALGAAAKHSQFESGAHGTSYLAQSVKMATGDHIDVAVAPAIVHPEPLLHVDPVIFRIPVMPVFYSAPPSAPLIV